MFDLQVQSLGADFVAPLEMKLDTDAKATAVCLHETNHSHSLMHALLFTFVESLESEFMTEYQITSELMHACSLKVIQQTCHVIQAT